MDWVNPSLSPNPLWDYIHKPNQPMFVRLFHMDYILKHTQLCLFVYSMWIKSQTEIPKTAKQNQHNLNIEHVISLEI